MATQPKQTGTAVALPTMEAGGNVLAIVPQTPEQIDAYAERMFKAQDVLPKSYKDKPPAVIAAAITKGLEVGFKPQQALSAIAFINGTASIFGDALSALMFQHGHHVDFHIEGEGDDIKGVATLTRGDTGRTITREFTFRDAKRAGLLSKKGPWTEYPKRMLQMRARAWVCRDGAPDVLMGLSVVEEMQDLESMRDVTPAGEGAAARPETAMQRKIRLQKEADAAKRTVPAAVVVQEAQASTRLDGETSTVDAKAEVQDPKPATETEAQIDEAEDRHANQKAKATVEDAEVIEEGSGRGLDDDDEPREKTQEEIDEEIYNPTAASFEAGQKAFKEGKPIEKIPAYSKEQNSASWRMGWRLAQKAAAPSDGDAE